MTAHFSNAKAKIEYCMNYLIPSKNWSNLQVNKTSFVSRFSCLGTFLSQETPCNTLKRRDRVTKLLLHPAPGGQGQGMMESNNNCKRCAKTAAPQLDSDMKFVSFRLRHHHHFFRTASKARTCRYRTACIGFYWPALATCTHHLYQ